MKNTFVFYLVEKYRQWKWERDFRRAKAALGLMLQNKDPQIYEQVALCAHELARQMCMQWLDNQKIQHCALCPNSKPLLYVGRRYLCPGHAEREAKKNGAATTPALEVVS